MRKKWPAETQNGGPVSAYAMRKYDTVQEAFAFHAYAVFEMSDDAKRRIQKLNGATIKKYVWNEECMYAPSTELHVSVLFFTRVVRT